MGDLPAPVAPGVLPFFFSRFLSSFVSQVTTPTKATPKKQAANSYKSSPTKKPYYNKKDQGFNKKKPQQKRQEYVGGEKFSALRADLKGVGGVKKKKKKLFLV